MAPVHSYDSILLGLYHCINPDARRFKGAEDTFEESGTFRRKEKVKEALFDCSCLFDESCWHHLVIVIHRNVMRGATASLYLDGAVVDTKKVGGVSL